MYRIELSPGEEALFKDMDELAKGIQNGVISSHARIWHAASGKWLPIDFHPHYKMAKARRITPPAPAPLIRPPAPTPVASSASPAPPTPVAPAPAPMAPAPKPAAPTPVAEIPAPAAETPAPVIPAPVPIVATPKSRTRELEFIELEPTAPKAAPAAAPSAAQLYLDQSPAHAATPRHIEALVAVAKDLPAPVEHHEEPLIDISAPSRRISFNPRIMGMAAGVLLVAAAGGALVARATGDEAPPAEELTMASTSLAATPTPAFEVSPQPEPINPAMMPTAEPGIPFRGNRVAEEVVVPTEAKDTAVPVVVPNAPSLARAPLGVGATGIEVSTRDAQAELESRLRGTGFGNLFSVSRLSAGSVAETRLAVAGAGGFVRTYRAQASKPESNTGARVADALLSDADAVLGILVGQQGGYEIAGSAIVFRDTASAREYARLRQRINTRLNSGDAGSPVAESLMRVLGAARLPVESVASN